jgi:hypothetical protein
LYKLATEPGVVGHSANPLFSELQNEATSLINNWLVDNISLAMTITKESQDNLMVMAIWTGDLSDIISPLLQYARYIPGKSD